MDYGEIHSKFETYLTQSLSDAESAEIISCVETKLASFIRSHLDVNFGDIYSNTNADVYTKYRSDVSNNRSANTENKNCNYLYTKALKYYASFLASKMFKGKSKVALTDKEKELRSKKAKKQKEDPLLPPEDQTEELKEGQLRQVNFTKHERNRALRQKCLEHYGYVCQVCGMDFERRYGAIGKNFIEVHHLFPISNTDGEHQVDPIRELVPLCCNCHSMIHRGGQNGVPMTLQRLKEEYAIHNQ